MATLHLHRRMIVWAACVSFFYTIIPVVEGGSYGRPNSAAAMISECPLVSALLDNNLAREERSKCAFLVLSLSSYIYRPGQELDFMLLSANGRQDVKFYNIEVTDQQGRAVGRFTRGDNICSSQTMLTHGTKRQNPFKKILFTWRAPNYDAGTLFFRFSVGVQNSDGTFNVWLKCDSRTPLKYYIEIPEQILRSIESPLSDHINFRRVGVALPPTPTNSNTNSRSPALPTTNTKLNPKPLSVTMPPIHDSSNTNHGTRDAASPPTPINTQRVVQEYPTAHTREDVVENRLAITPVQGRLTNIRLGPVPSFSGDGQIDTDGFSWCKPFRAPRFTIISGTDCTKYSMYPNSQTFFCFPGLMFSVRNCGCTYKWPETPCTFP